MSQMFDKIKVGTSKRSTFDLSHHQVTTSDFGYLIPVCYRDMVPNDDFVVKPSAFVRLSPLAVPVYGRITCRLHSFFVPYRVLFDEWDSFITHSKSNFVGIPSAAAQDLDTVLHDDKQLSSSGTKPRGTYCKLASNLGLNPATIGMSFTTNSDLISMLPFLAYQRIYLDYYLDSSLNDHETLIKNFKFTYCQGGRIDDTDFPDILKIRSCCYKKDYFTTAKLNPQEGSTPSTVGVDIAGSDLNPALNPSPTTTANLMMNTNGTIYRSNSGSQSSATSKIGQFTVEALRAATSLQRYLERNNYVGSKLINRLLAHFGVAPSAERLDMAEYLGGSSFPVQIGDVTSTNSFTTEGRDDITTQGLGLQAGKGVGAGAGDTVRYHAKEHGIFMTLMSILPDTGYYQGVSRFWFKGVTGDPLDFYTPEFENLGYQEILNREVYLPESTYASQHYQTFEPKAVFGYVPRYSEYKFQNDILGSDFIGVPPSVGDESYQSMDSWHLFRKLVFSDEDPVALNNNFVELNNRNNDYDRIFQLTSTEFDHFYINVDVDVKATRDMTGFAEPSIDSTNNQGNGNEVELPYGGTRL